MTFDQAMRFQAEFCERSDAPVTAACCRALTEVLDDISETGRRTRNWPGDPIRDALPLRLVAPFHALHRRGELAAMDDVAALRAAVAAYDSWISGWLDGPPQTNEAARSASFMAALLVLGERFGLPFELLEIGSSAGMNLLIDRYRYDLGGVKVGPEASPILIEPEWRGSPPPAADVRIASVRGCDIAPIDARDPAAAERLTAYTWVDAPARAARIEAAVRMMAEKPVDLVQGDAADWIEARLAEPQRDGVCRVVMHSIIWQYLGPDKQDRIRAAIDLAGGKGSPFAWIRMEPDEARKRIYLDVTVSPVGESMRLAETHPHGSWIEWIA